MTTLNISLPDPMKQFVEREVAEGGYSSSSEYVRALIRREQQRAGKAEIEDMLLEGLASGRPVQLSEKDWQNMKDGVVRRHKRRTKK